MKLSIVTPRPLGPIRTMVESVFASMPAVPSKVFVSPSQVYPDREKDCGRFIQIRPVSEMHRLRVLWGLPIKQEGLWGKKDTCYFVKKICQRLSVWCGGLFVVRSRSRRSWKSLSCDQATRMGK
jgi:secreted Zn-dependent insulinase-like peptidase